MESEWNVWVWLLGVVVRRYIDFLILRIPTPLVSVLFCSNIPTFWSFLIKMFFVLLYIVCENSLKMIICNVIMALSHALTTYQSVGILFSNQNLSSHHFPVTEDAFTVFNCNRPQDNDLSFGLCVDLAGF